MIGHLDGHAVVRAAGNEPHAVGHLFGDDAFALVARRIGQRQRGHRRVGLHLLDGQVEHRVPAAGLAHARRKFDAAAEVAVVAVEGQARRVAQHRVGEGGVDLRHQAVGTDRHRGAIAPGLRERQHLRAALARAQAGVVALRRLERAVRRDPKLVHAVGDEARSRRDVAANDVPCHLARDELVVALLAGQRIAAAAARLGARQRDLVAHRAGFVVDRAHHGVVSHFGPGAARHEGLTEGEAFALAGVADRLHLRRAHGRRGARQHVGRARRRGGTRGGERGGAEHGGRSGKE